MNKNRKYLNGILKNATPEQLVIISAFAGIVGNMKLSEFGKYAKVLNIVNAASMLTETQIDSYCRIMNITADASAKGAI